MSTERLTVERLKDAIKKTGLGITRSQWWDFHYKGELDNRPMFEVCTGCPMTIFAIAELGVDKTALSDTVVTGGHWEWLKLIIRAYFGADYLDSFVYRFDTDTNNSTHYSTGRAGEANRDAAACRAAWLSGEFDEKDTHDS